MTSELRKYIVAFPFLNCHRQQLHRPPRTFALAKRCLQPGSRPSLPPCYCTGTSPPLTAQTCVQCILPEPCPLGPFSPCCSPPSFLGSLSSVLRRRRTRIKVIHYRKLAPRQVRHNVAAALGFNHGCPSFRHRGAAAIWQLQVETIRRKAFAMLTWRTWVILATLQTSTCSGLGATPRPQSRGHTGWQWRSGRACLQRRKLCMLAALRFTAIPPVLGELHRYF